MTISSPADELVERVARAIEGARCNGREGPFGGFDYGHNPDFYGPEPEGGRYVVRDFRNPGSSDYGKWVHQTHDRDEHEREFKRLTEHHIARAAIAAMPDLTDRVRRLEEALTNLETEARRFAAFYPEASDGRNTFVIFADKIARTALGEPQC